MITPSIRRVTVEDVAAYRDIRLEALLNAPTAFGGNHAQESQNSLKDFEGYLTNSYVAGAWLDGVLVGTAGFRRETHAKVAHRGNIWGVYVKPEARGHGLARALITRLLDQARAEVEQVHLCVTTSNAHAYRLYQDLGFVTYGTEPRSLRVDGAYHDEHMMVLRFDA